jgi:hypothetical protein
MNKQKKQEEREKESEYRLFRVEMVAKALSGM